MGQTSEMFPDEQKHKYFSWVSLKLLWIVNFLTGYRSTTSYGKYRVTVKKYICSCYFVILYTHEEISNILRTLLVWTPELQSSRTMHRGRITLATMMQIIPMGVLVMVQRISSKFWDSTACSRVLRKLGRGLHIISIIISLSRSVCTKQSFTHEFFTAVDSFNWDSCIDKDMGELESPVPECLIAGIVNCSITSWIWMSIRGWVETTGGFLRPEPFFRSFSRLCCRSFTNFMASSTMVALSRFHHTDRDCTSAWVCSWFWVKKNQMFTAGDHS